MMEDIWKGITIPPWQVSLVIEELSFCVIAVPGTMLSETKALAKLASYGSMNLLWFCVNNGASK